MTHDPKNTEWLIDADVPCKAEPDLFFLPRITDDGSYGMSEDALDARIETAKDMCLDCPFMFQCLDRARANHEPHGVWGGEWFVNGKPGIRARRGRPADDTSSEDARFPMITLDHVLSPIARQTITGLAEAAADATRPRPAAPVLSLDAHRAAKQAPHPTEDDPAPVGQVPVLWQQLFLDTEAA